MLEKWTWEHDSMSSEVMETWFCTRLAVYDTGLQWHRSYNKHTFTCTNTHTHRRGTKQRIVGLHARCLGDENQSDSSPTGGTPSPSSPLQTPLSSLAGVREWERQRQRDVFLLILVCFQILSPSVTDSCSNKRCLYKNFWIKTKNVHAVAYGVNLFC